MQFTPVQVVFSVLQKHCCCAGTAGAVFSPRLTLYTLRCCSPNSYEKPNRMRSLTKRWIAIAFCSSVVQSCVAVAAASTMDGWSLSIKPYGRVHSCMVDLLSSGGSAACMEVGLPSYAKGGSGCPGTQAGCSQLRVDAPYNYTTMITRQSGTSALGI